MNDVQTDTQPAPNKKRALLIAVTLGAIVGVTVGLVATAFRLLLVLLDERRTAFFGGLSDVPVLGWLIPMLVTGLALLAAAELVRRFAPEAAGSGIQEIEGALQGERPLRWRRVLPVKFFGGLFSIGSGAVLGREGPTVQIGGALAGMVSEFFSLDKNTRKSLVASGAAAGLAASFNAPLAAFIFVVEEMRRSFPYKLNSLEMLAIAAACGDIVMRMGAGQEPVIHLPSLPTPQLSSLWLFLLFGALVGLIGVVFNKVVVGTLDTIRRLPPLANRLAPFAIGVALGALWLWEPYTIGGGYHVIGEAASGHITGGFLMTLFAIRFMTTILSYGSGTPGGIFMPMLTMGTLLGLFFGTGYEAIDPGAAPHPGVFAVAGMAAFFAATVQAPLTGIVLVVEMTGDFGLLLPLMLAVIGATVSSSMLNGRPIYDVLLKRILRLQKTDASPDA